MWPEGSRKGQVSVFGGLQFGLYSRSDKDPFRKPSMN